MILHYKLFTIYMNLVEEGYKIYYGKLVAQLRTYKDVYLSQASIIFSISHPHLIR